MIAFPDNGGRVSIDGGDSLEALLQPDILEGLDGNGSSMPTSEVSREVVTREPELARHSDTSDTQRLLEAKPQPPADIRPSGRATLAVERIVLRGQDVPVETVWAAEVPRSPDDFSVDVRLSNGMTVVVNNRRELNGRWFVMAKDSSSTGHLLARFQRREASGLGLVHQTITVLGSPFSSEVSTLLVLLLAVLVTLSPAADHRADLAPPPPAHPAAHPVLANQTALDGAGRALGYWLRFALANTRGPPQWLEPLADSAWLEPALAQAGLRRHGAEAPLRLLLLLTLLLAFVGRLAGKAALAFPVRCAHGLVLKPGSGADLEGLLGGAGSALGRQRSGGGVSDGHSLCYGLTKLWHDAIRPPEEEREPGARLGAGRAEGGGEEGEGGGGGEGGGAAREGGEEGARSGARSGEISISMAGFYLACSTMQQASEALGGFIALANKNDEGNLRKLKKAWAALERSEANGRGGGNRCATVRGLLELERDSGIHGAGGVLADPSAAMAILWLRRSMDFMVGVQANVMALDEGGSKRGDSMKRAAFEAYAEHLEPFHNWLLKNTFQVALKLVPSKREFLQRLGPLVAEEVTEAELRDHAEVVKQITDTLRTLFRELDLEDTRKV